APARVQQAAGREQRAGTPAGEDLELAAAPVARRISQNEAAAAGRSARTLRNCATLGHRGSPGPDGLSDLEIRAELCARPSPEKEEARSSNCSRRKARARSDLRRSFGTGRAARAQRRPEGGDSQSLHRAPLRAGRSQN